MTLVEGQKGGRRGKSYAGIRGTGLKKGKQGIPKRRKEGKRYIGQYENIIMVEKRGREKRGEGNKAKVLILEQVKR